MMNRVIDRRLCAFVGGTAGADVRVTRFGVRVVGLAQAWAYAARADLENLGVTAGSAQVEFVVKVVGEMSAGILSRDETHFLTETPIPAVTGRQSIRLAIDDATRGSAIIFRTGPTAKDKPRLTILQMRVNGKDCIAPQPDPDTEYDPEWESAGDGEVIDPLIDSLWELPHPRFGIARLKHWTWEDLDRHLTGDRLRDNLLLNKFEFATGRTLLRSYPFRLSVPFVLCNARCDFCAAWVVKGKPMPADLLDSLAPVVEHAIQIDMVGWGEPLIHPEFGEILERIQHRADARARISLTTNGVLLRPWVDRLLAANVTDYSISIHAATAKTHNDVMGLDPNLFPQVLDGMRYLVAKRKELPRPVRIAAVFIVMQQNIAEIPDFIQLCTELGIDYLFFRTLKPQQELPLGLNYHRLPPYLHPEFQRLREQAVAAIAAARIAVLASPETWSTPIFPETLEKTLHTIPLTVRAERPPTNRRGVEQTDELPIGQIDPANPALHGPYLGNETENPYGRKPPQRCPSPYTSVYVNGLDRQTNPCCYMEQIPGYQLMYLKKGTPFEVLWNSPAMVALRESLRKGPLMGPCLKCPFYW
jgi:pyruvate-formate lyase-activating enzyme